jgi:hypothetical protein
MALRTTGVVTLDSSASPWAILDQILPDLAHEWRTAEEEWHSLLAFPRYRVAFVVWEGLEPVDVISVVLTQVGGGNHHAKVWKVTPLSFPDPYPDQEDPETTRKEEDAILQTHVMSSYSTQHVLSSYRTYLLSWTRPSSSHVTFGGLLPIF